jgi:hypothetical protein
MRGAAVFVLILGLAGCGSTFPAGLNIGSKADTQITVTQDAVRLVAPKGFCVDPVSTKSGASDAFVLFGNCAAISGSHRQAQPDVQAVATASVTNGDGASAPIRATANKIKDFFMSDAGKRTLSRSGQSGDLTILDGFTRDGVVYLRAKDTSPGGLSGAEDVYWRGYFDVNSSVVAVSVLGLEDAPLSRDRGLGTLRAFVEATQKNVGLTEPATIAAPKQAAPKGENLQIGFLRRLFK